MKDEVLQKALSSDTSVIPRYDIVRPDGTKVAENVQLVLKNTVATVGTPLNKQSLLKDTTATAYNMNAVNAVPDDVLAAIRRSAGYCPRLKIKSLFGTTIYVMNTYTAVRSSYAVSFDDTVSIDILSFGTYKIWGVYNNVATTPIFLDVNEIKSYNLDIGSFIAYAKFTVTDEVGASIRARHSSGTVVTGIVGADKTCTLPLFNTGTWTCTGNYSGCDSQSQTINVTEEMRGTTTERSLAWTKIEVNIDHGSTITVTSGNTSKTDESIGGICIFWVPTSGTWSIVATLGDKTATSTAYPQMYQKQIVSMRYS